MKNFFALLFVVSFSISLVQAQIEKGTIFVGPASNLNYTSAGANGADEKTNTFNLQLGVGYFVAENLTIGLTAGVNSTKFRGIKSEATVIGPFARYYLNGQIILGVGYNSTKFTDQNSFGSVISQLGYAAFIGEVLAVEPSIGYAVGVGDNNTNNISFNIGFGIYLNRN